MYSILIYTLIIISFLIIILILSQPSKQQDALSLLSSDKSSQLFKTQKSSGTQYLLQYITACLGTSWLILGIVLVSLT
ncbi:preprotein translocase subunit SecG [Lactococcus petauri]|uniref:preprotein translocase subunit SecG n=1 Tax=Lactococcus petauri TaxID=1940789 RepID=UPI003853E56C